MLRHDYITPRRLAASPISARDAKILRYYYTSSELEDVRVDDTFVRSHSTTTTFTGALNAYFSPDGLKLYFDESETVLNVASRDLATAYELDSISETVNASIETEDSQLQQFITIGLRHFALFTAGKNLKVRELTSPSDLTTATDLIDLTFDDKTLVGVHYNPTIGKIFIIDTPDDGTERRASIYNLADLTVNESTMEVANLDLQVAGTNIRLNAFDYITTDEAGEKLFITTINPRMFYPQIVQFGYTPDNPLTFEHLIDPRLPAGYTGRITRVINRSIGSPQFSNDGRMFFFTQGQYIYRLSLPTAYSLIGAEYEVTNPDGFPSARVQLDPFVEESSHLSGQVYGEITQNNTGTQRFFGFVNALDEDLRFEYEDSTIASPWQASSAKVRWVLGRVAKSASQPNRIFIENTSTALEQFYMTLDDENSDGVEQGSINDAVSKSIKGRGLKVAVEGASIILDVDSQESITITVLSGNSNFKPYIIIRSNIENEDRFILDREIGDTLSIHFGTQLATPSTILDHQTNVQWRDRPQSSNRYRQSVLYEKGDGEEYLVYRLGLHESFQVFSDELEIIFYSSAVEVPPAISPVLETATSTTLFEKDAIPFWTPVSDLTAQEGNLTFQLARMRPLARTRLFYIINGAEDRIEALAISGLQLFFEDKDFEVVNIANGMSVNIVGDGTMVSSVQDIGEQNVLRNKAGPLRLFFGKPRTLEQMIQAYDAQNVWSIEPSEETRWKMTLKLDDDNNIIAVYTERATDALAYARGYNPGSYQ